MVEGCLGVWLVFRFLAQEYFQLHHWSKEFQPEEQAGCLRVGWFFFFRAVDFTLPMCDGLVEGLLDGVWEKGIPGMSSDDCSSS